MIPGCPHRSSAYATPRPASSSAFRICCFPFAGVRVGGAPLISFFPLGLGFRSSCPYSGYPFCGPCRPSGVLSARLRTSMGEGCRRTCLCWD
eukprot:15966769-Heterocapsa_arctica.AAC.1